MSVHLKVINPDRLASAVQASGYRIKHIADQVGIVRQTLWSLTAGEQAKLDAAKAVELCNLLAVPLGEAFALDTDVDLSTLVRATQDGAEAAQ